MSSYFDKIQINFIVLEIHLLQNTFDSHFQSFLKYVFIYMHADTKYVLYYLKYTHYLQMCEINA